MTRREPLDARIRRSVTDLAVDLDLEAILEPDAVRVVNGTELLAGEFLQREAIRSVAYLGRNEGRARRVIQDMVFDGEIELVRTIPRGRHPWRVYRLGRSHAGARVAQPDNWSLPVSLVKRDPYSPMPDWLADELEDWGDPAEPTTRGERREQRRRADLHRLREWWPDLPDDAPQRLLNILDHDEPAWLWQNGEPGPAARRWSRDRTNQGLEGRLHCGNGGTGGHHVC